MIVITLSIFAAPVAAYKYTQRYVKDVVNNTATQGIFFQKTIYLDKYKQLGKGNGLFGEYERYSRSDRHEDVLTIYFK